MQYHISQLYEENIIYVDLLIKFISFNFILNYKQFVKKL